MTAWAHGYVNCRCTSITLGVSPRKMSSVIGLCHVAFTQRTIHLHQLTRRFTWNLCSSKHCSAISQSLKMMLRSSRLLLNLYPMWWSTQNNYKLIGFHDCILVASGISIEIKNSDSILSQRTYVALNQLAKRVLFPASSFLDIDDLHNTSFNCCGSIREVNLPKSWGKFSRIRRMRVYRYRNKTCTFDSGPIQCALTYCGN